ncbi:LysR family transcriptional regulator [Gynuella sunshinyii]|uniref:Transcriptional regulator n=1 Tax=Gynuella sunshinyii YC6258 TaxID=1445510 RepID=A0A0C5V5Z0_9GAMM|nr:LysR family transcriptional regulator [Gynuella sunshinyii]AJQ94870.1 transcriptional regulator [Gynuella sunshinyii YC6258]
MSLPPIHELQAFQKVAQYLNFKKAADSVSITPSTLSHLIKSLENRLHIRLFNRTTRSVSLTDEGLDFFTQINPVLSDLKQAVDKVGSTRNETQGTVRISVNEVAAPIILDRLGADFRQRFPDVKIDLIVENRFIDIVSEGFDAGVRLRDKVPEDMVAIPILNNFRFVTVASQAYINDFGIPETPEELLNHNCIGFQFQSGRRHEWEFQQGTKSITLDVKGTLTTNSPAILCKAAKNSFGIAMIAESLIYKELDSNELVMILDDWALDWPSLYLYFPKNRHMAPALRTVIDELKL